MGETQRFSEFLAALNPDTIPSRLRDLAKLYTLDTIGVAIHASQKPWSRIIKARARALLASPDATILATDWKSTPQAAALVNGTMAHGFELDDVHDESLLHPGAVVVPAALAVAEAHHRSGLEFLVAVVAGYEAMCRIGLAVGSYSHILKGFHATGTAGTFGAAVAAGKLLGGRQEDFVHALGIAGSLSSGLMEFSQTGGMVKRLHAGRAAEGGILAAYLTLDGFTGPTTILEGKYGYCRTFSDAPEIGRLVDCLGERYAIEEITVKPYACCSDLHATIDALVEIRNAHAIDPMSLDRVLVEGTSKMVEQNGINGTTSIMAAQYSIPFTVAATLLYDIRDPQIYREETLRDPAVRALAARVELRRDGEIDHLYPRVLATRVVLRTQSGAEFTATVHGAKGSPKNPMTPAEIEDKFVRLTRGVLPAGRPERVVEAVRRLDELPDVAHLTELLSVDESAHGVSRTERS